MHSTHFDLLYSNSICRQSSIPTSILMLLLSSGYCDNVWTMISCSRTKSLNRFTTVTRRKYLNTRNTNLELHKCKRIKELSDYLSRFYKCTFYSTTGPFTHLILIWFDQLLIMRLLPPHLTGHVDCLSQS